MNHTFELYTLEVHVLGDPSTFACGHEPGMNLTVKGEDIIVETENRRFSLYALSALLPILPAKQRPAEEADWMTTDSKIACPDPNCGAVFEIVRRDKAVFKHDDVTKVPMPKEKN